MKNDDVELIQRVLAGDENAFAELVKKYQKPVHALAWRKIGDFHIAEEITQDAFLKVYQRLDTLKDPNQFSGWLYVIATRRCYAWLRKKRVRTQPLEDVETTMTQRDTYSKHVTEERVKTTIEAQREVVKRLLSKLKESERTVMTLHYFGEMTCEEISKFLGVSAGTIKSRLQRARNRLQKEEPMIREALDHFQISPNLTDNILREVARLKPGLPTGSKPLVPWAVAASSALLIMLMLSIGSQYLARFQKPYSLDAQTEMTVELIDAPIVLNLEVKPDIQNQLGNSKALGKSDNRGEKPDAVLLAAAQTEGEDVSVAKQQWVKSEPTRGSMVEGLLATSEGEIYTFARGHIYKLQDDRTEWQYLSDISTLAGDWELEVPMAKWDNTLYILPSNKLLASKDDGKTWYIVHQLPEEYDFPRKLLLTEQAFYIIFDEGAFRSEDKGKTWKDISNEYPGELQSLVTIQDKMFAITNSGLYRWNSDSWQRLEFPVPEAIGVITAAATKDRLYVMAEFTDPEAALKGQQRTWWIFRSTDLGNSWKDITPTNAWSLEGWPPGIRLVAAGGTLLVMERGMVRSTDGGDTWMPPQAPDISPMRTFTNIPAVALNERVFYVSSDDELHRSTDGGKSWNIVNIDPDKDNSFISDLIVYNESNKGQNMLPTIYGNNGNLLKTTDKGKSWKTILPDTLMQDPNRKEPPNIIQIVKSDGVIYAKGTESPFSSPETRIYRISADGNTLVPIQDMPIFDSSRLESLLLNRNGAFLSEKSFAKQLQESSSGATQFFKKLAQMDSIHPNYRRLFQDNLRQFGLIGPFAISGDTFYMEYNFKLFRWKQGDTEWYDTDQEETVELPLRIAIRELKLAVSGNTVYVGKRDGHLVVSFDKGTNWIDLTSALPFPFKTFKEIVFAGPTVYLATDAGVAASDNGKHWRSVTDSERTNLIMERLAVDGNTLYGVTEKTGIYRLKNGTWEQVVSEIPEGITSLAVDENTLYVGTEDRGMRYINLEK